MFLGVMSCFKNHLQREACRDNWFWKYPEARFFIGGSVDCEDCVRLDCPDDFASLPLKSFLMMKWFLDHTTESWYVKCDDDSFPLDLSLEGLFGTMWTPPKHFPPFRHKGFSDHSTYMGPWPMGGHGYMLDRATVERIVFDGRWTFEDKMVGDIVGQGQFLERMLFAHPVSVEEMYRYNRLEDVGIVTAASSSYLPGLALLQESVSFPLHCYDLDNLSLSLPLKPKGMTDHDYRIWIKPWLIRDAPFKHCLWIDADCVVLRGIEEAVALARAGFFVSEDCYKPELCLNERALYTLKRVPVVTRRTLCAGVIFCNPLRDKAIFESWMGLILEAFESVRLRRTIRWWDQGALLWTLHSVRRLNCISSDRRFCQAYPNELRVKRPREGILEALRLEWPDTRILHWPGGDKLHECLF